MDKPTNSKIAVVGLGALFPDARDSAEFWRNIASKRVSIRPLPESMFESEVFYRPDLLTAFTKDDKSITRIAGWIKDLSFDTVRKYKIPPSVAEHMDTNQHAALYTAGQALEMNSLADVPRDRVAVVFGNGMVGTRYGDAMFRVQFQLMEHYLRTHEAFRLVPSQQQDELVAFVRDNVLRDTIPITEDTAPGVLPNIIAGRIANVYDFHGPSFTVDAACASVLAAVIAGIQGLRLGEYDAVICGGADMPLKQLGFVLFSAINALSPDGSYPFDKRANGFVMGQGAGAVILKRLPDAIRNGDRIYALITGYGMASDGKGKYIAAPNADWQAYTIERACRMAGYPVDTIELIEAHGTATRVGDVVEVAGLKQAFARLGASRTNYCGLTSVKSNIGHLKSAAGIAGLIKGILAIHHKMLPPTANFQEVNPKLELEGSPFYILDELREWEAKPAHPRRANVSSFGFGGADYHLALEEYRPEDHRQPVYAGFAAQPAPAVAPAIQSNRSGGEESIFFSAATPVAVDAQVQAFLAACASQPEMSFSDRVLLHNYTVRPQEVRLAILASSPEELASRYLNTTEASQPNVELLRTKGVYQGQGQPVTPAETAILFPGQASQYPGMFRSAYETYDVMRTWLRRADAHWLAEHGHTVTALLFPDGVSEEAALERMRPTHHAHPCIFVTSYALYDLLRQMGLAADTMIGHSLGEITALAAAGKISAHDALRLVAQRGYAFYDERLPDPGKMISVMASLAEATQLIADSGCNVSVANINSPRQIIIAGGSAAIDQFKAYLDAKKAADPRQAISSKLLFVSHAFHTSLMQPVADRFYGRIKDIPFRPSPIRVMMNHRGAYYPDDPQEISIIAALLREQIVQPVDFAGSVRALRNAGVKLFVEVGPGAILSGLVRETLSDEAGVRVLTSNFKGADDLVSLRKLCAALFAEGVPMAPVATRGAETPASASVRSEAPAPIPIQTTAPGAALAERRPVTQPGGRSPQPPAQGEIVVVYSGAAIGLPGSYKAAFGDDNFEQLFAGRNLIERLTDIERQRQVDLQISKLIKDESGPTFKLLTALDDVIQLAGKAGRIDMVRDYHIDEKTVMNMTSSIALGVAAGYEALRDARIPLVREYSRTTTGRMLPQKLALPAEMQDDTGVIFANGFPLIDPVIHEVSRYVAYQYGSKTRRELLAFYESIIERVKDPTAKKLLTDWYVLYYGRLNDNPGEEDVYRFNHHFMTQISAQANNLLATLLNARGPNFQLNAACSSTSNAITIAEDFIRTGRVKRMIVVGADDPTTRDNLPLLGAGFLCTGAATNETDLYKAAIPFDRRRNGMIVGAGAVGIVLETRAEVERRGVREICQLLGTHSFNTAKHISQIDTETFAVEMDRFISRMEREHGLRRPEIARQTVYISHETFTPPRGGCSQTEAEALRRTFGADVRHIIVGNTKGMTGHTMGASLEDAVAAKSLQYGKCPPVVNFAQPDPMLEGLHLWQGGVHDRTLALKMSAGFGAQGHFALLRKSAAGDDRIADAAKYAAWLKSAAGDEGAATEQFGRVLVTHDGRSAAATTLSSAPPAMSAPAQAEKAPVLATRTVAPTGKPAAPPEALAVPRPQAAGLREAVIAEVLQTFAEITKYSREMLDLDMEMEADLGIDTVKQATILARLGERYGMAPQEGMQLSNYPTIRHIVDLILDQGQAAQPHAALDSGQAPGISRPRDVAYPVAAPAALLVETAALGDSVVALIAEVTGYPPEMLEPDMEVVADLGIKADRQDAVLRRLEERFGLPVGSLQIAAETTIGGVTAQVAQGVAATAGAPAGQVARRKAPRPGAAGLREAVVAEVLQTFAEITKYSREMLDLDMEMEADLGIDTVKQATILARLGERYGMAPQEGMQLSNYPTIRHIVDLILDQGQAAQPHAALDSEPSAEASPQPTPATSLAVHSELSREVVTLIPEALGPKEYAIEEKMVWVLGDDPAIAEAVAAACTERGAVTKTFAFAGLATPQQVTEAFAAFTGAQRADVIIDCTHIGSAVSFAELVPDDATELLFRSSEARFAVYKHLAGQGWRPARIVCLTAIDGALGLGGEQARVLDPTFGALLGFYKGLRKEWAGTAVRIVDLAPQAVTESLDICIQLAIDEIERTGAGVEVAYPHGQRLIAVTISKALQSQERLTFTGRDTFLITGGGSGVTAHVLLALAQMTPASFVVVDLEPLPENIAALAALDEQGLERLKQERHAQLRQEHGRVTPAMLEREFGKVLKAVEIYNNLGALRALGRKVVYLPCDVRDLEALRPQLAHARQEVGPITAVVHAAGVDRSHLLEQKSHEEFHTVFSVKAQGAYNVMALCRDDPLRLVVAFGSISGRFGNAAQLDYCAANSFLNTWTQAMRLRDWPRGTSERESPPQADPVRVHAVCLEWSGWKDVGIAWRNEVVRQTAEEMGLNFIEIDQGVAAFWQEIANRTGDSEVVLHRGLDGFIEEGLAFPCLLDFPLIDRVTSEIPQPSMARPHISRAYRVLSVRRDALIDQHRLGKTPIMPAVGYAELAVEYYALQAGVQAQYVLRGMAFPAAFKLFHEQPRELFVEGRETAVAGAWAVEIKSAFRPVVGDDIQIIQHSHATVSAGPPDLAGLDPQSWDCYRAQPISLPASQSLLLLTNSGPEQRILLGPLYNDVMREAESKEPVLVYPAGVVYPTYFPLEQLTNKRYPLERMLVNPCFLDSLYQACAAHLLVKKQRVYLPWEVEELGILAAPRQEGLYRSYAQVVEESDQVIGFDVVMLDGAGQVRYYARRARFRLINL